LSGVRKGLAVRPGDQQINSPGCAPSSDDSGGGDARRHGAAAMMRAMKL
jgi:hypothetical protein